MRAVFSFRAAIVVSAAVSLTVVLSIALTAAGDDSEARERVILMKSGRILTGFASRNAGGWLLEQSNGRVQVPLDEVNLVATSLVDAYRQQRDSVVKPTPATHMSLAHWCISYRLHNEAREEVRECLKLDPEHSSARKLLRRLDDILDPRDTKAAPKEPVSRRTADGFLVPDAESLGGLSNESASTFTQRIQPLLMNKCGNASCHGTTSPIDKMEGFYLIPVRNGSNANRLYAERNLATVMRYVDIQEPSLSPLVTLPQGSHGGTAGVFHGTAGNTQIKMLRAWIKTVAEEKRTEEEEISNRSTIASRNRKSNIAAPSPLDGPRLLDNPPAELDRATVANAKPLPGESAMPLASKPSTPPMNKDVLAKGPVSKADFTSSHSLAETKAAAAQLPSRADLAGDGIDDDRPSDDPFDPEIFNRRFHSSPRR